MVQINFIKEWRLFLVALLVTLQIQPALTAEMRPSGLFAIDANLLGSQVNGIGVWQLISPSDEDTESETITEFECRRDYGACAVSHGSIDGKGGYSTRVSVFKIASWTATKGGFPTPLTLKAIADDICFRQTLFVEVTPKIATLEVSPHGPRSACELLPNWKPGHVETLRLMSPDDATQFASKHRTR